MIESLVGAIVLAYGPASYGRVLADLNDQGMNPRRIVVVHNPRTSTEPDLRPLSDDVAVVRMKINLGYARAMNAAMRHQAMQDCRHILLLTHDVRLDPECVTRLVSASERAPEYGALGPALWHEGTGQPFSFGADVSSNARVRHRVDRPGQGLGSGVVTVGYLDGAVLLICMQAFAEVGPLDERFFMYYEDAEWCVRLARSGWKVGVVPDAHARQSSGKANHPGATAFLFMRNGLEFARSVAGVRGVLAEFGRQSGATPGHLRRAVSGPSAVARRVARAHLTGAIVGAVSFACRRWGPPPRWLPGQGDIRPTDIDLV